MFSFFIDMHKSNSGYHVQINFQAFQLFFYRNDSNNFQANNYPFVNTLQFFLYKGLSASKSQVSSSINKSLSIFK